MATEPQPTEATEVEETQATEPQPQPQAPKGPILVRDKYKVYPTVPIPELDTPTATAFKAVDPNEPTFEIIAYVCLPNSLPRITDFSVFRGTSYHSILTLHEFDVVFWPPFGHKTTVFIYDKPLGGRLSTVLAQELKTISVHDISDEVIVPITQGIKSLAARGAPHRNIRPDNLFYKDAERTQLVLGECLSSPTGFNQPPVYETVERSMAHRAARGAGNEADDVYALGVTVLYLLLEKKRTEYMTADEIIDLKISGGSFRAIVGDEPMLPKLVEPLRGMLTDDHFARWTIDDIEFWIDGRRQRPTQRPRALAAKRPIKFGKEEFLSLRPLARAMANTEKRDQALQIIRGGTLENWLRRGLEDNDTGNAAHTAAQITSTYHTDPTKAEDILIANTCMILDPEAPVRFKGFCFMPEGFGTAFAYEYLQESRGKLAIEAIACDVVGLWFEARAGAVAVLSNEKTEFSRYKSYLTTVDPGFGVERCLYESYKGLHCLSPLIAQDYVSDITEVLPALDDAGKRVDTQSMPIDRHLAAFISTHFNYNIEKHLKAFASTEPEVRILGMLSILAVMQWKLKEKELLGLSSWAGGLMGPALSVYQSRTTRRDVEKEIPKIVREGSLPELYNLFDNAERINDDYKDFQAAKAEYLQADMEISDIRSAEKQAERAEQLGQQTAAVTGIVIALIIMALTFMTRNV
ncbi:MAG: serine/threonine-protein kinase [Alphaproteobacteria bacterium]|nr:serine/threonine-protein kinase [Rhodospirillales bacterium]MCW9046146.1 serine/threonine-protein kinase [Alphaproteobacteria bacterium]